MAAPLFEQLLKFITHGRIFESLRYYTEGLEQCLLRSSHVCVTCWSVLATRIKKWSGQHTKKYFKSWSRDLEELWVTKMWAIKVWLIFEPLLNQEIKSFRMKWSSDQGQLWQHTSDYPFCLTSSIPTKSILFWWCTLCSSVKLNADKTPRTKLLNSYLHSKSPVMDHHWSSGPALQISTHSLFSTFLYKEAVSTISVTSHLLVTLLLKSSERVVESITSTVLSCISDTNSNCS